MFLFLFQPIIFLSHLFLPVRKLLVLKVSVTLLVFSIKILKNRRSPSKVLKLLWICNKFTGQNSCWAVISINFHSNLFEITLPHCCSLVSLSDIFKIPFKKKPLGVRFWKIFERAESYLGVYQISMMELFVKIGHGQNPLVMFAKTSSQMFDITLNTSSVELLFAFT